MRPLDFALKLLGLADVICAWQGRLARLDASRRREIATYAEAIAEALARLGAAVDRLEMDAADRRARHAAIREMGRLTGYMETLVGTLRGHMDGRRLAGAERRLRALADEAGILGALQRPAPQRVERILAAEGYMRALADGLRV